MIHTARALPSVDGLLGSPVLVALQGREPREVVVKAARDVLAETRETLLAGGEPVAYDWLTRAIAERVERAALLPLGRVLNATGIVLHTNLGRAPLSAEALRAVEAAARDYGNLEYDMRLGVRSSRHDLVVELLRQVTGAEAALVVNNNAAALLLALSAVAAGREAIISRGELIEIGGGFRIPDVMAQSGARLIEVGTTNRTYAEDFSAAVGSDSGLLLRVHTSNFRLVGFFHSPTVLELATLSAQTGVPLLDDLGSGSLLDTSAFGLAREPLVQDSVAAGCDLVTFSGDKLLGGPQAGVIVGKKLFVDRLKRHPLTRALRPDKMTLAALSATLRHYARHEAIEKIPVWRMLSARDGGLACRCREIVSALVGEGRRDVTVISTRAAVGGGSLPGETLPSWALSLGSPSPDRLAARLRQASPPIVPRIEGQRVLLDLRTVLPEYDRDLLAALRGVFQDPGICPVA